MTKPADLAELKANAAAMSARLKIMSHPERLLMLCRMDEGEASVTELVALTALSQSAVSQHLALLREEDIVAIRSRIARGGYTAPRPPKSTGITSRRTPAPRTSA